MKICDEDKCTSCYACYNICPKKCIEMKEDNYGFIRPNINYNICIKCNLCKKICPAINEIENNIPKIAYAAWANEEIERMSSTSGGAASVFSRYILESNGVVFGAALSNKIVRHIKIDSIHGLIELKGSKYVQSKIENTYEEAKTELDNKKRVLFIGTPCQIAGLKQYSQKDYDNLFTIDIICHGTPSQRFLIDYIKENLKIKDFDKISFRDNRGYYFKLMKEDKVLCDLNMNQSLYYMGFMQGILCNSACYECKYANNKRISDVTIGDFWGLGTEKEFKHDKSNGVSVILINTEKGLNLVNDCKEKMFLEERNVLEAINGNSQLTHPSSKHKNYELFRKVYKKNGFSKAIHKSLWKEINIQKIKNVIKKNKFIFMFIKNVRNIR